MLALGNKGKHMGGRRENCFHITDKLIEQFGLKSISNDP